MAVSKSPRKKPLTAAVEEDKPATKAKAAPVKKAAPKKAEPAEPKAKAPAKASAKPRTAKAGTVAKAEEPASKPALAPPVAPQAVVKKAPVTPALTPLAQTILTAICEGRAVEFIFADADANAPRTFEPRQLTFEALSEAWYVWGWDRRYNAERHHRVDLLAEVNAVEGVGRAAQGPYADGTPANQIGGWLGGEPIAVKATLMKQWVFAVKQAPPAFPNFKIEDQGDGQALISFTATDLRAIARWAMQFGDGVQVLEPARLVDRIKQVGAVWAGRDRLPAAAPAPKASSRPEPTEPHRSESRHHRDRESKPEREARPPRESEREARPPRESEREDAPHKSKPGKVEVIRFDRL
jgi:predicted DNA-binding transcriptional regulator YafY